MRWAALVGLCLLLGGPLLAQKRFLSVYGTSDSDYGNTVIATDDGGYALINQTQYLGNLLPQVIRTDCNGNIIWTRAFRYGNITSGFDLAAVGANIALLLSYHESPTGDPVTVLALLDFYGNLIWAKQVPLTTGGNGHLVVEQGGFVICGNPSSTDSSVAMLRLDNNGEVTASAEIKLVNPCVPTAVCKLNTGQYAFTGSYPSEILPGFKDMIMVLTDEDFLPVKAAVYSTYYDDEPSGIIADDNNNIYVCGRSYFLTNNWDAFLIGFNTSLSPVLVRYYDAGTPEGEVFRGITRPRAGGGFALCGDLGAFDERVPIVIKTETNGHIIFSKQYNLSTAFTNYFFSITSTPDNGFAVTGDVRPVFGLRDAPLLKTDAMGNDSCYMQDITLNAYTPVYSVNPQGFLWSVSAISSVDTLPVTENIPIHQTDICNPKNPCPAFYFDAYSRCPGMCYDFHDQSIDASSWHWEFEGAEPAVSNAEDPSGICYHQDGVYIVKLVVSNSTGSTTLEKEIDVRVGCEPVFPNIITPDGDGINDAFVIGMLPKEYELKIFDRWGILIDTFTTPDKTWKGTTSGGSKVIPGVYFYTFFNKISGKTYKGFVQVAYR